MTPSRRRWLQALGAGLGLALVRTAAAQASPADMVSLDEARAAHAAGRALLIDIREPQEHARGVAAGARLLPMSQIQQRWREIPTDPKQPVLLICNTQNRSSATLRALRQQGGYGHVRYVHGGMAEWMRRGLPTVPPAR